MLKNKTLIISSWSPPMIGGPQNLYTLFSKFNPKYYYMLTSYAEIAHASNLQGEWLPCEYYFYNHKGPIEKDSFHEQLSKPTKIIGKIKKPIINIIKTLPILNFLLVLFFSLTKTYLMTTKGLSIIKEKKPNLIMGISDHGPSLIAAYIISKITGLPFCIYLFDIYLGNDLVTADKFIAKLFEKKIFLSASKILVTNEGTEYFYKNRYGSNLPITVIHNSILLSDYLKTNIQHNPKDPYSILYTGHVYWPQWQALKNIIYAMDILKDYNIRLDLYIPKPPDKLLKLINGKNNITLSNTKPSDIPRIQNLASLLFLPLTWRKKGRDIIETASPGKFTSYLASGRPILIHAPEYAFITKYSQENKLAITVTQNDPEILAAIIKKIIKSPNITEQYIINSINILKKDYDNLKNSKKLAETLNSIKPIK